MPSLDQCGTGQLRKGHPLGDIRSVDNDNEASTRGYQYPPVVILSRKSRIINSDSAPEHATDKKTEKKQQMQSKT